MNNEVELKKVCCNLCTSNCRVDVEVRKGEVVAVRRSDEVEFGIKGFVCDRLRLAALNFHNEPRRLNYPLKRIGARGEGKWQRVSWQQAMDEIAGKVEQVRGRYGPEAIGCLLGNGTWVHRWLGHRWCNLFGTPNREHVASVTLKSPACQTGWCL